MSADSPPPQIVQLREIIRAVRDRDGMPPLEFTETDRSGLLVAIRLVDRLIEQYPVLTQ